jgi:hypothetical protein
VRLAGAAAALRVHLDRPAVASEQATHNELVHLAVLQHRLNRSMVASDHAILECRLALARQTLSADEQATAWAEGQTMPQAQAIAYALDE